MKIKVIAMLMAAGCALLFQSCAPIRTTKLAAIAFTDQKVGFGDTIISRKKHSVSLSPYEELDVAKDKTLFMLGVQNNGDASFDIGYDDITVDFQNSGGMTLPASGMRIQTYEDFMDDLIEEQSTKERELIKDGLEDIDIEFENQTVKMGALSGESLELFLLFVSDYFEDMIESLVSNAKIMRDNDRLLREAMTEIVMSPQTVMPGGAYSGIVVCDTRSLDEIIEGRFQVAVLVGGEEHVFTFDRVLNK